MPGWVRALSSPSLKKYASFTASTLRFFPNGGIPRSLPSRDFTPCARMMPVTHSFARNANAWGTRLLPPGSNAPGSREGHASRSANSSSLWGREQDSSLAETRRPASSLYSCSVDSRAAFPADQIPFRVSQPRHSLGPAHVLCEHLPPPNRRITLQSQTEELTPSRKKSPYVARSLLANYGMEFLRSTDAKMRGRSPGAFA